MIEILRSGGPVMVPLALCSVVALAIVVERLFNLREIKVLPQSGVERLRELISDSEFERAEEYALSRPSPFNNIVLAALRSRFESRDSLRDAVRDAGRQEIPRLERYLGILETVVSISPLLGLLGTVLGMIRVFAVISSEGVGQADALAGGISEAMITTATGLAIAIPALAAYNFLIGRAEGMVLEMERLTLEMVKLLLARRGGSSSSAGEGV